MQKRVFIVHAWECTPRMYWYPWLSDQLSENGFAVSVPEMPDTVSPKLSGWLPKLAETVNGTDENCYFVGHSLGCITIMRYLESLHPGEKAGGAVFVAGFSSSLGFEATSSFFQTDVNYEVIKSHCNKFVSLCSDNDPYVPLKYGEMLKDKLGAELIIKHDMKHFNGDMRQLQDALDAVMRISNQ